MPETFFKKLNQKIPSVLKVCFFSALLVGLLAHGYKITNWLPNWDSLVFRYDAQNMIGLGRWFLPVVTALSSYYDLPFLNGLIALLFHALGAAVSCKILKVENKVCAALAGAVIVSFPTVTSVLMYNYVADGYGIAFFLACLAAYFMTKEKPSVLLGALLLCLSVGIYQAYVTCAVVLVLLSLLSDLLFENKKTKPLLKKGGLALLSGALGMALYYGILKILLALFSMELLDYQGASEVLSAEGVNLPAALYIIKETFLSCFFNTDGGIGPLFVLNALIVLVTVLSVVGILFKEKSFQKLPLLVLLALLLIPAGSALALINPFVDYHSLMRMGYVFLYLLFLVLYEKKGSVLRSWAVFSLALLLIASQVVIANVAYHKAQIAYEKSYGELVRIADRIDATDGAADCTKLLVVGELAGSEAYRATVETDITGITDGLILRHDDEVVGQSVLCSALNDYCGKTFAFVHGEEKKALLATDAVKNMGVWPEEGCTLTVDDTLVIKVGKQ